MRSRSPSISVGTIQSALTGRYPSQLVTVDSHTAGEPTRLLLAGVPSLPGETMAAKRVSFMERHDQIRRLLACEPRGHRDMVVAVLTEPCTDGADFGILYMDARRYPFLCGHATMGAVTTLLELGLLGKQGQETTVTVDTPSGPIQALARIEQERVRSVSVRTVPSFVLRQNVPLQVAELGETPVDLVCVGGFFVMVDEVWTQIPLAPENGPELVRLGMRIIEEANRQLLVHHPERPEVTTVDVVEFHGTRGKDGINAVVYGESHLDRSPCGTGTAAKLTLLQARGMLQPGQSYLNRSFLGSGFKGRIHEICRIGEIEGIVAEIEGSAHITGMHQFVLDREDPFPGGFLL